MLIALENCCGKVVASEEAQSKNRCASSVNQSIRPRKRIIPLALPTISGSTCGLEMETFGLEFIV
jgi:hypothetical protein